MLIGIVQRQNSGYHWVSYRHDCRYFTTAAALASSVLGSSPVAAVQTDTNLHAVEVKSFMYQRVTYYWPPQQQKHSSTGTPSGRAESRQYTCLPPPRTVRPSGDGAAATVNKRNKLNS